MTDSHSDIAPTDVVRTTLEWVERVDEPPATIDEVFRLLADRRRRLLLLVLRRYDEPLTLPDAAEAVAERETGRSIVDLSPDRVAEVYISLYHDHLPRLVDAGLLRYDQERDMVAPNGL